jgi:hypothetical protein
VEEEEDFVILWSSWAWKFSFVNVAAEECVLQTSQQVDEKIMWGVWN